MKLLFSLSSLVVAAVVVTVTLTACGNKNTNMVVSSATPVGLYATSLVAFRINSGASLPAFNHYTTFAWGFNGNGQLGLANNDTISPSYTPTGVSMANGMNGITGVAVGGSHCLAFRNLSTVWAWGNNYSGQLGTGLVNTTTINTIATSVPFQVINATTSGHLTRVTAISAGGNHSLALTSDGTVWSWGGNYSGQLGDATPSTVTTLKNRSVAVQVQKDATIGNFLTGVTKISAGGSHNLALSDGTLVAWGLNNYGQLGNNTSPLTTPAVLYSTVPVPVVFKDIGGNIIPSPIVTAIAAGGSHSLALDINGDVWAWGFNSVGQLGLGTGLFEPVTPVPHAYAVKVWDHNNLPVSDSSPVIQISAGLDHSLVLLADGSVYAWGSNFFGQLGHGDPLKGTPDNTAAAFPTPVQVLTQVSTSTKPAIPLSNIRSIVAIGTHNLAQDSSKRWWAWGENTYGQLGIGSNLDGTPIIDQNIAVKVTGFP